jgi:NADPH:quinone reductase-like Zn-dependent oxidoreductase
MLLLSDDFIPKCQKKEEQMKAVRIKEWGQPVQVEDIPQPTPNSDEILVRVHAASVNPVDLAVAAGYLQSMLGAPMTLGTDFAGKVVSVGADVKHVKPGDEVYGFVPIRGGTFAEYAIAKANEVAHKPRSLDYAQASVVPLVALTAWQSLDLARLQNGERLLIHGAGGGVGSFAAQFAKDRGAYVIGTAGPGTDAFLRELGVDQYINYEEQRFEDIARDVDVVLSTARGDLAQRSYGAMKPGGRLVATVEQPPQAEAEQRGIRASSVITQPNADHLAKVADLIDSGRVKVFVRRAFPLEEAQAALEASQQRHKPGKVVLTVD